MQQGCHQPHCYLALAGDGINFLNTRICRSFLLEELRDSGQKSNCLLLCHTVNDWRLFGIISA